VVASLLVSRERLSVDEERSDEEHLGRFARQVSTGFNRLREA